MAPNNVYFIYIIIFIYSTELSMYIGYWTNVIINMTYSYNFIIYSHIVYIVYIFTYCTRTRINGKIDVGE